MAELHVHRVTVSGHRLSCEDRVLVAGSMGHDAIQLELSAEWQGLSVVVAVGRDARVDLLPWDGEPVAIPAAQMAVPGYLPVGVAGYADGGRVRVLTAEADTLLRVVPSGPYEGGDPAPDEPDLLGQLLEARDEANEAAEAAREAAEAAGSVSRGTQVSVTSGRPTVGGKLGDSAIDPVTGQFWEFVDTGSAD